MGSKQKKTSGNDYVAVIDIGSNSVRLVVFSTLKRVPDIIFNEKILCGLGAGLAKTGRMSAGAMAEALSTLKRYRALCDQMGVDHIDTFATAAVRDASNGGDFVKQVRTLCGFDIRVIDGEEESRLAALGVLSGEPAARGIVGDLGGGSLELAEVAGGRVGRRLSLPYGALRLMHSFGDDLEGIKAHVRAGLKEIDWLADAEGQDLFLVGGSWRNIIKLLMHERASQLAILQGFRVPRQELSSYCRRLSLSHPDNLPFAADIPSRRREVLPVAALILRETLKAMKVQSAVVSSYGVREGILFDRLPKDVRAQDPFIAACRELAEERCRFPEHADILFDWTRPLFNGGLWYTPESRARLHLAICLLGDIAWRGHPDFRAEKAVEIALHGQFIGVGHEDRAFVAVALNQAYGAPVTVPQIAHVLPLLSVDAILEARVLGAALRLAQRLSGGAAQALTMSHLRLQDGRLLLGAPADARDIVNDVVVKRLRQLALLIGCDSDVELYAEKADKAGRKTADNAA